MLNDSLLHTVDFYIQRRMEEIAFLVNFIARLLQYLIYSICWVSCCLKIIAPGSKQRVDLSFELQDCRLGKTPTRIWHHLCDLKDWHQKITYTSHLFFESLANLKFESLASATDIFLVWFYHNRNSERNMKIGNKFNTFFIAFQYLKLNMCSKL